VIAIARSLQLSEFYGERGRTVSDLADLPRGLLSLEQWDALELDPTRRWELSEGTLNMSPRPQLGNASKLTLRSCILPYSM